MAWGREIAAGCPGRKLSSGRSSSDRKSSFTFSGGWRIGQESGSTYGFNRKIWTVMETRRSSVAEIVPCGMVHGNCVQASWRGLSDSSVCRPILYHQGCIWAALPSCHDNLSCVTVHVEYSPWQFCEQSQYVRQLMHSALLWTEKFPTVEVGKHL